MSQPQIETTERYVLQKKLPPDPGSRRLSEWEYVTCFANEHDARLHLQGKFGTYRIVCSITKSWVHLETTIEPAPTAPVAPAPQPADKIKFREFL